MDFALLVLLLSAFLGQLDGRPAEKSARAFDLQEDNPNVKIFSAYPIDGTAKEGSTNELRTGKDDKIFRVANEEGEEHLQEEQNHEGHEENGEYHANENNEDLVSANHEIGEEENEEISRDETPLVEPEVEFPALKSEPISPIAIGNVPFEVEEDSDDLFDDFEDIPSLLQPNTGIRVGVVLPDSNLFNTQNQETVEGAQKSSQALKPESPIEPKAEANIPVDPMAAQSEDSIPVETPLRTDIQETANVEADQNEVQVDEVAIEKSNLTPVETSDANILTPDVEVKNEENTIQVSEMVNENIEPMAVEPQTVSLDESNQLSKANVEKSIIPESEIIEQMIEPVAVMQDPSKMTVEVEEEFNTEENAATSSNTEIAQDEIAPIAEIDNEIANPMVSIPNDEAIMQNDLEPTAEENLESVAEPEPIAVEEPEPEPIAVEEPEPEPNAVEEPEPEPIAEENLKNEPEPEPIAVEEPEPEPVAEENMKNEPEPEPVVEENALENIPQPIEEENTLKSDLPNPNQETEVNPIVEPVQDNQEGPIESTPLEKEAVDLTVEALSETEKAVELEDQVPVEAEHQVKSEISPVETEAIESEKPIDENQDSLLSSANPEDELNKPHAENIEKEAEAVETIPNETA